MSNVPLNSHLINRLIWLRKDAHIKQHEVERQLSMAKGTLSRIENGQRELTWHELYQLAELYKVSLDWLTFRSEERMLAEERSEQIVLDYMASMTPHELTLYETGLYLSKKRNKFPKPPASILR